MVLSHKKARKLKKQLRTFTNEDVGGYVIDYLNRTDRLADDPVEKLVNLAERLRSGEDVRDEMVQLINSTVGSRPEYSTVCIASRTPEGTVTVRDVPALKGTIEIAFAEHLLEWNRGMVLLKRGMLNRIRHCKKPDCRKLFWARFSHSEYHDESCRLAVEAASPIYRERRRDYMREQRELEKAGKER